MASISEIKQAFRFRVYSIEYKRISGKTDLKNVYHLSAISDWKIYLVAPRPL
jgi:hypothetical protein